MVARRKGKLSATEAAVRALRSRDLSEAEMRERLTRGGYDEGSVERAVGDLREWGYLKDEALADRLAARSVERRIGRARAVRELQARGLDETVVVRAVEIHYEGRDTELLEESLNRALQALGGVRTEREFRRLARRLMARGFDADLVLERLRRAGFEGE